MIEIVVGFIVTIISGVFLFHYSDWRNRRHKKVDDRSNSEHENCQTRTSTLKPRFLGATNETDIASHLTAGEELFLTYIAKHGVVNTNDVKEYGGKARMDLMAHYSFVKAIHTNDGGSHQWELSAKGMRVVSALEKLKS